MEDFWSLTITTWLCLVFFQSLLQEFEDMFQDKEIPPIRGTEHNIDFIPRTVIPYKPAYRVNPTETKEIQRQVEELMEKGYV